MDRFFIIGTDERIVIIRYISIIKFVFQQKFPLFVRGRTFKFLCVWLEGRLRKGNWKQRSMHRYGGRPHFVRTKKRCSVCHCRYVSRLIAKECHVPEGGQKTNNK